jgi:transcriptional regulator with GAF, ATPase, and Fis domain
MSAILDISAPRIDHIDAFHELLPTLARALDVRDIFERLSTIVGRIVPHDEANLALLTEDGTRFRLFASTGEPEPKLLCMGEHCAVRDPSVPRIFNDGFVRDRGFRSGLRVPVRVDSELIGVLALLSRAPDAYSPDELVLAQRVADYVAIAVSHQRLAEEARRAALERDRATNLESSVELLRAISGVLDVRAIFPRVSEIANKVLAHDRLSMAFNDGQGHISVQAASNDDFPHFARIVVGSDSLHTLEEPFFIIDDLEQTALPTVEPPDLRERIIEFGYRSFLKVQVTARDEHLGLMFWSKKRHAFSMEDVPIARRIADHLALAVSHEQLSEAARQVAEAQARAERLEARLKSVTRELDSRSGHERVVGESAEWKDVIRQAAQVSATDTTVLVTGESGTGKEVVARFIHRASARKDGPFVAINCAALPEQLLESELFGYERGAFTGAQQPKPGQIELAAGGVLFLDEVTEMSPSAQAKFLRVLQEREFQRLGGTRLQKADVRVIAATNRDLRKAVERGDFREDLYYRLQVFDIQLPPLRERPSDILMLSEAFLAEIAKSFGRLPTGMTRDAREALLKYHWPGNIRELRNALERAAIVSEGGLITAQHLSLHVAHEEPASTTTKLDVVERRTIERVLRETAGNKSKAARRLGLSRTQLYVRLRKYNLETPATLRET